MGVLGDWKVAQTGRQERLPYKATVHGSYGKSLSLLLPTRNQVVVNAEVIEYSRHHAVHDLFDGLRAIVKGRVGREQGRSCLQQQFEVFHMHQAQGRFTGHQNQFPLFLQHHVRRAQQHVFTVTMGDPPQRAHAARDHHHGIRRIRPAGEWGIHAAQAVPLDTGGQLEALPQFLGDHRLGILAEHDMHLVVGRAQMVKESLRIQRPAGSGDGDKDSQIGRSPRRIWPSRASLTSRQARNLSACERWRHSHNAGVSITMGLRFLASMVLLMAFVQSTCVAVDAPATQPSGSSPSQVGTSGRRSPTWIDLQDWAGQQDLGTLTRISASQDPSFELETPRGRLVLQTKSLRAFLRSRLIWLGFPPTLHGGRLYVHRLDVEKTLSPLLIEPLLDLPANAVIVIDPGHGGSNTGTRSTLDGSQEKQYTLDWARRVESMLAAQGRTVWLTRTNDIDLALDKRVAFATEKSADLFISLHFNSAGASHTQSGVEMFSFSPQGMPSHLKRGYPDDLAEVAPNNAHDSANIQLAAALRNALMQIPGVEDRGLKRARFMTVLRNQQCPAVLVEAGFLSNRDEAARIADAAYRHRLAEAVVSAINTFCPRADRSDAASLNSKPAGFKP